MVQCTDHIREIDCSENSLETSVMPMDFLASLDLRLRHSYNCSASNHAVLNMHYALNNFRVITLENDEKLAHAILLSITTSDAAFLLGKRTTMCFTFTISIIHLNFNPIFVLKRTFLCTSM